MPLPTASAYQQVTIQRGMVLSVDPVNYTVDVRTSGTYEYHETCPYMSPYVHPMGGEGIDFMPEEGSIVYLCHPSEGERLPFVIGWIMPEDTKGSSRANRKSLNRGDVRLSTRDGCEMWMHRGGVLEIGSGQMPRRMYIPTLNTIRDFCINYELYFVGGHDKYLVKRAETSASAKAEVVHDRSIRRLAKDKLATVEVKEGKVSDEVVLETSIYDVQSADQRTLKIKLQMGKDGKVSWTATDEWSLKSDTDVLIEAARDMVLVSGSGGGTKMELRADTGNLEMMSMTGNASLKAPSGMLTLAGSRSTLTIGNRGMAFQGPKFSVGSGAKHVVIDPGTLVNWLNSHVHEGVTVGPGTSGTPFVLLNVNSVKSKKMYGE
jgi:hypothetical protein